MKRNPPSNRAPFRGVILPTLLALAVFAIVVDGGPGPASTLRADDSAALETDHAFLDIENWGGTNWQAAGWPAIQIKKVRLERSIVQLGFDSVSPYVIGDSPNFLLRAQLDGRFVFLTNSREVAAGKPGAVLMQKKGRIFEGMLPRGGVLTDAAVDYGKETIHYTRGNLNPGNVNNPRFTSIRFIPARSGAGVGDNGGADSDGGDGNDNGNAGAGAGAGAGVAAVDGWEGFSLGIPAYYGGANWTVATWHGAQGKTVGKGAVVRIGYDELSIYRGAGQAAAGQNFLCRLVFKTGGTVFLTNSADVARRKGDVVIMERKDGCFEATVAGLGELKEVAVDFGESTLAYGRGTWSLNAKNKADVRFNSLKISPGTEARPEKSAQPASIAPASAAAVPQAAGQAGSLNTKAEYSTPAYYGGANWQVAVFTGARGLKLEKGAALRLHFDDASCFNRDANVSFLLRVVFENGKTVYASNSEKITAAAPDGKTARFALDKAARCFEGALAGLDGGGGVVREIAVDFGESTSHLPVPLNEGNSNNPRFSKLTVLEAARK
ncbi:MAG: hypothetical protein LBM04_08160 [Opitutaceae bacterium]|jgi:hypothetical protein|nr:hypothetical protein [Opitutaceae bacterium]